MIVKVKHTKNGNVKITMSLEQAEYLRNHLLESIYAEEYRAPIGMAKGALRHLENQLELAGITY